MVVHHMWVFQTILTVFWQYIDLPRSFHLWLPGNGCSTLGGPNNKMLHSPRGGFFLPFIFPWRTGFCVTDDESPVYCCIAPIRLFSRVALHNTKSPTLCDTMPILWRAELSTHAQWLPPTKLSICQLTPHARFGRTANHFVSFQSGSHWVFTLLLSKVCDQCFFFPSPVHVAEALPDSRQPLSVARQSRDRASVSVRHHLRSGVETTYRLLSGTKWNHPDQESNLNPFGCTDTETKLSQRAQTDWPASGNWGSSYLLRFDLSGGFETLTHFAFLPPWNLLYFGTPPKWLFFFSQKHK